MNPRLEKSAPGDDLAERLKQAEAALRERKLDLQLMVDSIPAQVAVITPTGEVETLNQPCLDYFGKTLEQLKGWDSSDPVHSEDLPHVIEVLTHALETGETYEVESRHRRFDGVYRWFHVRGFPLKDTGDRILRWCVLLTDIDDRKRAETQLAGEKRLLEMVASGADLTEILTQLCKFVENTAADCTCGIYLIDWWTTKFRLGAAPSLPASFNDPVEGLTVNRDAGPCGAAALTKSQVIVTDIEADSRFQSATIRPLLLAHGLRSHWSTPIFSRNGEVLGTFAIFQDDPSSPTELQQDLIAQVTHIASIAIERSLADEAVRSSERNLNLTINTIPTFISVSRPDGTVLSVNQAALDYHGITLQDVQKEDFRTRFFHPDDAERVREERKEALKRPLQFEYETRALGKDGKYRWFLVRCNPLLDDQGKIDRWYATAFDIEDRKRAEEALRSAERTLNQIINTIPTHIYVLNTEGSVQYVNQAVMDYTGLSLVDVKQEDYRDRVIHPEDFMRVRAGRAASLRRGAPFSTEQRVLGNDGQYRWFLVRYKPLLDEQGRIVRWYVAAFDIEDRKRAQEEVRRSEAFLAEAQRLTSIGSFSWLVAANEITWSEELYRIYEFDPGIKITLEVIRTRVHPEDLTLYEKMVEQARNGYEDFEWQYRLLMPDQSIKYMHAVAQATRDPSGQLEYIAAVRDVTARRTADEALDMARSELARVARVMSLGALTASIAHEVNQPLSGIITNASTCMRMLDAETPNVDGARETARRTIRDGRRAADVITRLRALFTNKVAAAELLDLNEATREVIALSRAELERNGVITRIDLVDELPKVMGDRVQLQQVILNLLRNGSDAMSNVDDRHREILFKTEVEEGNSVRLSVRDAGVGFEPQTLDRLFQSFYTTKSDGMGIGLSVSRSIIENHRGRLWATANDGPGVTFSFSLPCVDDAGYSRSKNDDNITEP
ncbi:MAG: PAS domain-containing protein [Pyrinomonadaceae bacterium]|nr:PAS domain-containing protein [Pyrinomonadaceae bacterium]